MKQLFKKKITMKFTFDELRAKNDWLVSEIMNSLTGECYTEQVMEDQCFEIMLSVNGNLIEPKLFNRILGNIETVVDNEARRIVKDELEAAQEKVRKLTILLENFSDHITDKIHTEFNLEKHDYADE